MDHCTSFSVILQENTMLSCIFSLLYNPMIHGCKKKDALFS